MPFIKLKNFRCDTEKCFPESLYKMTARPPAANLKFSNRRPAARKSFTRHPSEAMLKLAFLSIIISTIALTGCNEWSAGDIDERYDYDVVEKNTLSKTADINEEEDMNMGDDSIQNVNDVELDPRTVMLVELFDYITDKEKRDEIVDEIYAEESTFKDPVQAAKGKKNIKKVLSLLGLILDGIETDIKKDVISDNVLAIHWDMTFKVKFWPFSATVPGVTWMDLNEEGKCIAQVDYWDLACFLEQMLVIEPLKALLKIIPGYHMIVK